MTPNDDFTAAPQSPAPAPETPFWNYLDLIFLISVVLPSLFVGALLVRAISGILPIVKPSQALLAQLIAYALIFGCLYALLRARYGQPFWRSLGWNVRVPSATLSLLAGPLLAISVGYLGYILRAPEIEIPFRQMLQDRSTLIFFGIFVVGLGPLCEELAFRGFLMPLLMRSFTSVPGIVLTGALFGALHGSEYSWSWRHILLVAIAGTVFGWVRYRTGSTAAATFMHSSYNLTQFAFFVIQTRTA